jgi:taurine dioxygenase
MNAGYSKQGQASGTSVMTPAGEMPEEKVLEIFDQVGFEPPPGMPLQDAFDLFLMLVRKQQSQPRLKETPPRGRTAVRCKREDVKSVLERFGASFTVMDGPVGVEVHGVDTTKELAPELAGCLEMLMADYGLLLFRNQGNEQNEMDIKGKYLTGDEQCKLSLAFGAGALHSTHGNHHECPNRDIFRLSNDENHGFNEVGPEWHNDGSFQRDVFGHVIYHIVKAPEGPGNTAFAHLGKAFDALPPAQQELFQRCASINSNGGVVHPMAHEHPISGRKSLYLHTGMTSTIIERVGKPDGKDKLAGIKAWNREEMDKLFQEWTELFDRDDIRYNHKWQQGDVVIIDNLAVAHKAMPGAHKASSGLRILHRTTIKGLGTLDPLPELAFPIQFDTAGPCPFKDPGAVWIEGYVGFRWGNWKDRSTPH